MAWVGEAEGARERETEGQQLATRPRQARVELPMDPWDLEQCQGQGQSQGEAQGSRRGRWVPRHPEEWGWLWALGLRRGQGGGWVLEKSGALQVPALHQCRALPSLGQGLGPGLAVHRGASGRLPRGQAYSDRLVRYSDNCPCCRMVVGKITRSTGRTIHATVCFRGLTYKAYCNSYSCCPAEIRRCCSSVYCIASGLLAVVQYSSGGSCLLYACAISSSRATSAVLQYTTLVCSQDRGVKHSVPYTSASLLRN